MSSVIEMRPVITEITHHTQQVLMDGQTTAIHNASVTSCCQRHERAEVKKFSVDMVYGSVADVASHFATSLCT